MAQEERPRDRTCCGVIEEAAVAAREKRETRTKPQPWAVRKLMVLVTLGIIGYSGYVYIQHLCLPMIRQSSGAPAGRSTGIALLVVFCILYLWMIWAYIKVIMTPPGFAKDYISKSQRPLVPASVPMRQPSFHSTQEGPDLEAAHHTRNESLSATTAQSHTSNPRPRKDTGLAGPSYEDLMRRDGPPAQDQDSNAGVLDAIPKPVVADHRNANGHERSPTSSTTVAPQPQPTTLKKPKTRPSASEARQERMTDRGGTLDSMGIHRRPPTSAVLQPIHRYCSTDEILKPYRTHHCRVCGTCVLKYDHHCPWIGNCVGARNQKFFLNFCQATTVFTAYIFATLITYVVKAMNDPNGDLDPQEIVLLAIAALFFLFTSSLVASHVNLILKGQTTVESMQIHSMKERETATLSKGFGTCEIAAKQRRRRQWDREWGGLNTEGNIWWRGNSHAEWVDVMGKNPLGWFLPIGRSLGDGLSYPVNPRFDSEGRWRHRSEWPEDLR